MNTDSEIWVAFFRTFSMLFLVLALLLLVFYLIRRFSAQQGMKGSGNFIRVLATHHLSPKEKLVLVNVMDETVLIGVTPSSISRISVLDKSIPMTEIEGKSESGFSRLLGKALGKRSVAGSHPEMNDESEQAGNDAN